ncbi:MAG: hypothetical protein IJH34_18275, partial [Romboutsia sp.]|nr:hypothetical protein [Romboutsia sp.]
FLLFFLVGCGNDSGKNILNKLDNKIKKADSYYISGIMEIFNNEDKLLDKLYINEFEAMNLRYEFDNMNKLQSVFKTTKEYLEKGYELNQKIDIQYNKFRKRYFFENCSFECWISCNNLIKLEAIIYDNSNIEKDNIKEIKKLSFECEHKDINEFADIILNSVRNTLEEYEVDTHSIDFKILETNLKEICKGVNEYLNLKRDIHMHEYSKSPYCLGPLNNYIFGMNTNTIDIDFWYYDASDSGYDPHAGGASIGCDIRFFDDLDNYYFTDLVINNIYKDDKYKDIEFEFLVEYGLKKIQELMHKVKSTQK